MRHVLKCWPGLFEEVLAKRKTFEVRRDDRKFAVGDQLDLYQYDPQSETSSGAFVRVDVTYLLHCCEIPGHPLAHGFVVMGIRKRMAVCPG